MTNLLNIVKSIILKIYNIAPFGFGVIVGYIFKPEIKIVVDASILLVKGLLKL